MVKNSVRVSVYLLLKIYTDISLLTIVSWTLQHVKKKNS